MIHYLLPEEIDARVRRNLEHILLRQMNIALLNQQRLAPLFPPLIEKANLFISDCREEGLMILITQGLRTWAEQNDLYNQGRHGNPGKIVTNAKGGQSYHNFGLAFDIVPVDKNGHPIWDVTNEAWEIAQAIGELHPGSVNTRLDPVFAAQVVMQDLGLTLGADFHSIKDIPHYEMTGGVSLQILRNLYKPNNLSACWAEVIARL